MDSQQSELVDACQEIAEKYDLTYAGEEWIADIEEAKVCDFAMNTTGTIYYTTRAIMRLIASGVFGPEAARRCASQFEQDGGGTSGMFLRQGLSDDEYLVALYGVIVEIMLPMANVSDTQSAFKKAFCMSAVKGMNLVNTMRKMSITAARTICVLMGIGLINQDAMRDRLAEMRSYYERSLTLCDGEDRDFATAVDNAFRSTTGVLDKCDEPTRIAIEYAAMMGLMLLLVNADAVPDEVSGEFLQYTRDFQTERLAELEKDTSPEIAKSMRRLIERLAEVAARVCSEDLDDDEDE